MNITNEAILEKLIKGEDLDILVMRELMERMLSGAMPSAQIAASLALLRAKKESGIELSEASSIVMRHAVPIEKPAYLFADIVGTGGDGHNTINVSTLASLTAASMGIPVAKHGSVAASSKCGSADVLSEVGIDISLSPKNARRSLDDNNWCFLFAPLYHAGFKSTKDIRTELKIKTIFNILGPLSNPLEPPIMVIGVYDEALIMPFAEALKNLGRKRALIVHGSGLDEVALHGPTTAALLDDRSIEKLVFGPHDLGLKSYSLDAVKGGDKKDNAQFFIKLLSGQADEAKTSLVAASAGVLMWLFGKAQTFKDGVKMAERAIRAQEPWRTVLRMRGESDGTFNNR